MENVHWLALIVGALIPTIMGMIWYHPKVFGNAWMKSLGMTEEDLNGGNMAMIFGVALLMALLLSWQMMKSAGYHASGEADDLNFLHGAFHGAKYGLFLSIPVLVSNSLFERKTVTNVLINAIYWLVALGLMGGVVYALY